MALDLAAAFAEISKLGTDPSHSVAEFSHRVIDDICGRNINFSKEYSSIQGVHEVASTVQACIRKFFAKKLTPTEFSALLVEQNDIPSKVVKILVTAVETRKLEIRKRLVEHLVNISRSHMTDFDWSLRLTMATSHLSQVNDYPCLRSGCFAKMLKF